MLRPVTESLTPDEVLRLLTSEDLPERAIWATLRHLDRRGELNDLLADPEVRGLVTDWLRRTSQERTPPPRCRRSHRLRLSVSLRASAELQTSCRIVLLVRVAARPRRPRRLAGVDQAARRVRWR